MKAEQWSFNGIITFDKSSEASEKSIETMCEKALENPKPSHCFLFQGLIKKK